MIFTTKFALSFINKNGQKNHLTLTTNSTSLKLVSETIKILRKLVKVLKVTLVKLIKIKINSK